MHWIMKLRSGSGHSERDFVKAVKATLWAEVSPSILGVYFDPVVGEIVVHAVGGQLREIKRRWGLRPLLTSFSPIVVFLLPHTTNQENNHRYHDDGL